MRLELAALLLLTATAAHAGTAPPDSTKEPPPKIVITPARSFTVLDSTVADTTRTKPEPAIDMTSERKQGSASLEDLLPLRRPAILNALPVSGPTQGSLHLPGGGSEVRLDGWVHGGETTTDETWIGSTDLGWGAPWLAFALDDPRSVGQEALDLDALEFPGTPGAFRVPGEALTRPSPRGPAFPAGEDTSRTVQSRTTLLYRRGGADAQLTGARFETNVFHRTIYASYARNQSGAWSPLRHTLGWRYLLRANVGRFAGHRIAVEGLLSERAIEDSSLGAGEWERRYAAVHLAHDGARVSDAWRVGIGSSKATSVLTQDFNVSPDAGSRERWEFPAVTSEGMVSYRAGSAMTWIASFQAASRKIVYRADSLPAFEPRREEARGSLGMRTTLGPSTGAGLDVAYDARETQAGFLDGRASLWAESGRARGRIDVESAHERPTWMDLLTPATVHTFIAPTTFLQSDLTRSGDPTLRPRRLTGGLGFLGLTVSKGFELEASGSYRRLTDDFGWDVSADTVAGVLDVSSLARRRGSGSISHAGIGWNLTRGFLRSRGVGWIRGGPDSLSPQAGSPPRRALDASLELRFVLFQGDLPLRFGVESHARGPRRGLIREAGQVTWDGTISADFGSAGAYLRVQDLFDRRPGSAIWDPAHPEGAPMPGRLIQAGVVWNLLD